MNEIKESLKRILSDIDDLITEVEDSDEFADGDTQSEVLDDIEDARYYIDVALKVVR